MRKQDIYKNYITTLVEEKENQTSKHQSGSNSMLIQKGRIGGKENKNLGGHVRLATASKKRPESAVNSINFNQKRLKGQSAGSMVKSIENQQFPSNLTHKPFIPAIPLSSAER